ncbi:MAG: hypothetical protein A2Z20_12815 [Bdellovibrionales bacterium RBG_16_40_8]|nr:MAG: hypothetical protein A2Z20_12815 [Bdellovibrionales bacterium RBG_16_40_8]
MQQKYPAFRKIFANAQYNLSESQFWLGQYKDSLNSYIDFIQMFPVNKHGGFALTRIGELLEILGVDQRQFMGVYIESYFRFPDSPGSEVARIRMLSRGLKGMKDGEKKHALTEIDEISKKSNLPQIKEFTTILKSEGLARRGEFRNALDILITFYQQNPSTQNLKIIKSRTLRNISDVLKEETSKKNYIEALNFFGKYSTTWLKNSGRIDTQYYQALALEQAGVTKEAKKIYLKIYDQLKSIAGSNEEKERIVYENLPRLAQINLRLAATALEEKQYQEANKYLSQINEKLSEAEDIERVQIGAAVSEQTGDIKRAIAYLEKLNDNLLKNEKLIVKPELSLARLYLKQNKNAEADQHLSRIEKMTENKVELTDNEMSELLKLRGDLQLQSGQKIAAVETYMKLLDAYESKYPMSSIRYKAGKILFEEGDIRGAEKIWGALDDNTGALYKRLSSERLSQAKWQDNYKKYINRIPAAKELK